MLKKSRFKITNLFKIKYCLDSWLKDITITVFLVSIQFCPSFLKHFILKSSTFLHIFFAFNVVNIVYFFKIMHYNSMGGPF